MSFRYYVCVTLILICMFFALSSFKDSTCVSFEIVDLCFFVILAIPYTRNTWYRHRGDIVCSSSLIDCPDLLYLSFSMNKHYYCCYYYLLKNKLMSLLFLMIMTLERNVCNLNVRSNKLFFRVFLLFSQIVIYLRNVK